MGDTVATRCDRCRAEIARESMIAIKSVEGAYTCPTCGKNERLPRRTTAVVRHV
jgi:predicted RNA-binding Zn-ribbon protein involved in translation (DUF1610 family)